MFKRLFCWAYFRGSLFSEGLIIGRNFESQNGLGLTIKQLNRLRNSLNQLKTANPNSPWAYIREGLLWDGYLRLRFGALIFGRAYFWGGGGWGGGLSEFYGMVWSVWRRLRLEYFNTQYANAMLDFTLSPCMGISDEIDDATIAIDDPRDKAPI